MTSNSCIAEEREREVKILLSKFKFIYEVLKEDFPLLDIKVQFAAESQKMYQADHTLQKIHELKPRKVVLCLDNSTQPWLQQLLLGDVSKIIASRSPVPACILTEDLLRRLDNSDAFGF